MNNSKEIMKMINIDNAKKTKVSQLENKNQFIIQYVTDDGHTILCFQSYTTLIAIYDYKTKEIAINWVMWDYSKTTSKHLKIFINRYTPYNYENKHQFEKEILTNTMFVRFR